MSRQLSDTNEFEYESLYKSEEKAWITYIGYCLGCIILFVLLGNTCFQFYCKVDNINTSHTHTQTGRSRGQTSKRRGQSKTTSNYRSKRSKKDKILGPVKYATISMVLISFIYLFTAGLMRTYVFFYNYEFGCNWIEIPTTLFGASRGLLHVLFILRLYTSFRATAYRMSPVLLIIWVVMTALMFVLSFVYYMFYVQSKTEANQESCVGINYAAAGIPFYCVDTVNGVILVGVFIKRLTTLMHAQAQNSVSVPDSKLMHLVTKLSTLVSVSVSSSWILVLTVGLLLQFPGLSAAIDAVMNVICVLLCFEFHHSIYSFVCYPCKELCYICCLSYHTFLLRKSETDESTLSKMQSGFRAAMELEVNQDQVKSIAFENIPKNESRSSQLQMSNQVASGSTNSPILSNVEDSNDVSRDNNNNTRSASSQVTKITFVQKPSLLDIDIKYEHSQSQSKSKSKSNEPAV